MNNADLPFQPVRSTLYGSQELLRGFAVDKPQSIARTLDFESYVYFVEHGRATPRDPYAGMMEALHDNSILRAMFGFIADTARPTAAIMGGHGEPRGSDTYVRVAKLAKKLTEQGFLMASGGGPGTMEATHLGALLQGQDDAVLMDAIRELETRAELPDSARLVDPDGNANAAIVAAVHKWVLPAIHLAEQFPSGGLSLAVPTWHYGHEPLSPFASHVAKYFLNSIREDVLLALATQGIVFTPGRAGTLQEVFQDSSQNYYRGPQEPFSPMVFFGTKFWRETLPVEPLLESLFVKNGRESEYKAKVRFMDDVDEVVQFLVDQLATAKSAMTRLRAIGLGPVIEESQAGRVAMNDPGLVGGLVQTAHENGRPRANAPESHKATTSRRRAS
ncbi:Hypothetical protein A7982_05378 [Minicystis rosea]|nr:Hypothetical protein A7982_05378 [Minicystis rosea]